MNNQYAIYTLITPDNDYEDVQPMLVKKDDFQAIQQMAYEIYNEEREKNENGEEDISTSTIRDKILNTLCGKFEIMFLANCALTIAL